MRWLQFSKVNLSEGLGGVEVCARSLAREFRKLGHECVFSSDPHDLDNAFERWDVIHTHGSSPLSWTQWIKIRRQHKRPILVHTLHGTTWGRMWACKEWLWLGGHLAQIREIFGVSIAQVVFVVRPNLWLAKCAKTLGKTVITVGLGWDSTENDLCELQQDLPVEKSWIYIGRGSDRVKAVQRIIRWMVTFPGHDLLAIPGEGFPHLPCIHFTGRLGARGIHEALDRGKGLILSSKYEGLSLVALEALSRGVPVVATQVGGLRYFPKELQGTYWIQPKDGDDPNAWQRATQEAEQNDSIHLRKQRAKQNQSLLQSWSQVAQAYLMGLPYRNKNPLTQK